MVHVPDTDTPLEPAPLGVSGKSIKPGKGIMCTNGGKGFTCSNGGVGILSNNGGKGVFGGITTVNKAGDIAMSTAGDVEPSAPSLPPTRRALSSCVSAPAGTTVYDRAGGVLYRAGSLSRPADTMATMGRAVAATPDNTTMGAMVQEMAAFLDFPHTNRGTR